MSIDDGAAYVYAFVACVTLIWNLGVEAGTTVVRGGFEEKI